MIEISQDGAVHIITMTAEPNTVQPAFVTAMNDALDQSEAAGAGAIVLTGKGKTFNAGLDVEALMAMAPDQLEAFGPGLMQMLTRLLTGPIPTVAAINGHAFAAGAFLALACDFRFMRDDRGWICISEVDVGVPVGKPLMTLLRRKVPTTTAAEAVLTGKRYNASDAIAAGFADVAAPQADLLSLATARGAELASKEKGIMANLKKTLWEDVAAALNA
ncbi:MAG: enoyl-CoA hydratase/carnithine racemase [Hyphomicrobiaceae bacterium]|jgi:enoyl-CoA hydratase/carnithine racemase